MGGPAAYQLRIPGATDVAGAVRVLRRGMPHGTPPLERLVLETLAAKSLSQAADGADLFSVHTMRGAALGADVKARAGAQEYRLGELLDNLHRAGLVDRWRDVSGVTVRLRAGELLPPGAAPPPAPAPAGAAGSRGGSWGQEAAPAAPAPSAGGGSGGSRGGSRGQEQGRGQEAPPPPPPPLRAAEAPWAPAQGREGEEARPGAASAKARGGAARPAFALPTPLTLPRPIERAAWNFPNITLGPLVFRVHAPVHLPSLGLTLESAEPGAVRDALAAAINGQSVRRPGGAVDAEATGLLRAVLGAVLLASELAPTGRAPGELALSSCFAVDAHWALEELMGSLGAAPGTPAAALWDSEVGFWPHAGELVRFCQTRQPTECGRLLEFWKVPNAAYNWLARYLLRADRLLPPEALEAAALTPGAVGKEARAAGTLADRDFVFLPSHIAIEQLYSQGGGANGAAAAGKHGGAAPANGAKAGEHRAGAAAAEGGRQQNGTAPKGGDAAAVAAAPAAPAAVAAQAPPPPQERRPKGAAPVRPTPVPLPLQQPNGSGPQQGGGGAEQAGNARAPPDAAFSDDAFGGVAPSPLELLRRLQAAGRAGAARAAGLTPQLVGAYMAAHCAKEQGQGGAVLWALLEGGELAAACAFMRAALRIAGAELEALELGRAED